MGVSALWYWQIWPCHLSLCQKACGRQETRHQERTESGHLTTPRASGLDTLTSQNRLSSWHNHKTTFVLFYESVLPTFRKEKNKTTQVRTKTNKRYSSKNIQYICCIKLYRMSWTFSFTYTIHKGQNRVTFTSFMILRKCPLRQPHFMYIFTHKPDKTALGCTLRGHDEIQMPCIKIPEKCLSVR